MAYDDVSHDVYTPEIVIGGILHIDIFNFPQLPKKQLKWTMRSILSTNEILSRKYYPDPNSIAAGTIDPQNISFKIPNYVYIHNRDDIKVGLWDFESQTWKMGSEYVENISIDNSNQLKCAVFKFNPVAMI